MTHDNNDISQKQWAMLLAPRDTVLYTLARTPHHKADHPLLPVRMPLYER